jgi:putative ATPase
MIRTMDGDSLFERTNLGAQPLAARMRPRTLDEFVGQEHILGPGKLLRRAIQADMLSSLIFYGPPGTGKTTLAQVIANTTRSAFISLNAVLAGVKDVRASIDTARHNLDFHDRRTILFVDEVHRWNKAQQDALLPWVENGTVILIGATTHNPFFEVNSALVSRSRIFQLKPLSDQDLRTIADTVCRDPVRGYGQFTVTIAKDALDHLISVSGGDARALLGALQLAVETTGESYPPPPGTAVHVDRAIAEDSIQQKAVLYDKEGDYHFDVISAFIKSLRGSDPDAALYWMAKMVHSGEDPRFIFRRMLIAASEDVGLADPNALTVVNSAAAAFDRVGMPEGRFFLAQAALYLATCSKSNSALGFFDALSSVEHESEGEVPNHLRDANRDKKGFGHGEGYLYPHAFRDHWVAQAYLPVELRGRLFYQPSDQGYEASVRERVLELRELQMELGLEDGTPEVLTYSPEADRSTARWIARTEDGGAAFAEVRTRLKHAVRTARHHTVLVAGRTPSLFLWTALRSCPEGLVAAIFTDRRRYETARHHARQAHPLLSPVLLDAATVDLDALRTATGNPVPIGRDEPDSSAAADDWQSRVAGVRFDRIVLTEPAGLGPSWDELFSGLVGLIAAEGLLALAQRVPAESQRLSDLVRLQDDDLRDLLRGAEERLFESRQDPVFAVRSTVIEDAVKSSFDIRSLEKVDVVETRTISRRHLDAWFSTDRESGLAAALLAAGGSHELDRISSAAVASLADRPVQWRTRFLVATAGVRAAGR